MLHRFLIIEKVSKNFCQIPECSLSVGILIRPSFFLRLKINHFNIIESFWIH